MNELKKDLRLPYINEDDFTKSYIDPCEKSYQLILKDLEQFCQFFTKDLHRFINQPSSPQAQEEELLQQQQ